MADVLHGCSPKRMQSVGYMQVIPLVSDLSDDRFASPSEAHSEVFTTEYGTLGFRNSGERLLIVPCHAGYVVKQAAQDHAMPNTGLVPPAGERSFNNAMCIQQAQGGMISRGEYRMLILPHALREQALQMRREKNYSKLWEAIAAFNNQMGVRATGHLEFFLDHFRRELDEFVAEFECVPRQIGAIILIDDQVVGVERAPSHTYWNGIWPSLIRECYGSLAIRVTQLKGECPTLPVSRRPLPSAHSLDELETIIADIAQQEDDQAKATVREILREQLTLRKDESMAGLSLETTESDRFAGQVVSDEQRVVYASLPASRHWLANNDWQKAQPFSI